MYTSPSLGTPTPQHNLTHATPNPPPCRSYIFSQTVFTMRAGVFSRWNGVVVAASELVLFALPFSVVQVGGVQCCWHCGLHCNFHFVGLVLFALPFSVVQVGGVL